MNNQVATAHRGMAHGCLSQLPYWTLPTIQVNLQNCFDYVTDIIYP